MSKPWTLSGPLLPVVLGIGGAWGARLVALQAYQPLFIAAALASLGYAWFWLYRRPEACAPGEGCAVPEVRRRQRAVFWNVAVIAAGLMAFPLYAPPFY